MTRRPMNLFFPFSVTISTVVTMLLWQRAMSAARAPFEAVGDTMLATLMALAVVEHWFLVAPFDGNALWRAFRRRAGRSDPTRRRRSSNCEFAGRGLRHRADADDYDARQGRH